MLLQVTFTALLLGQAGEDRPAPPDLLRELHADLKKFAPYQQRQMRYVWRPQTMDAMQWEYFAPVLHGHPNQLSRLSRRVPLARVGKHLLRVYLRDYGWTPEQWDNLSDPYSLDPDAVAVKYVDVQRLVWWDGPDWDEHRGVWPGDGKFYARRAFQYKKWVREAVGGHKAVRALAPWFVADGGDETIARDVVAWTGTSAPLVHAEWWFNQTAAGENRAGGYYSWLGIKTVGDFEKLIGFEEKTAKVFRFELRASVARSGVTNRPRAFERWDSLGGAYWKSLEFINPKIGNSPLNVFGREIAKFSDGSEGYGLLPNELWATYAANKAGKLLDAVPGTIASDHTSRSNDKQVHVNVSCRRCHGPSPGELHAIDDWARKLFQPPLQFRPVVDEKDKYDLEKLEAQEIELREQYLRDLKVFIATDAARYERAIKELTGLGAKEYAKRYAEFWEWYEDRAVTAEIAALDLGIGAADLRRKLLTHVKLGRELSPVASVFVHADVDGVDGKKIKLAQSIGIREYEQVHAELQAIHRSIK